MFEVELKNQIVLDSMLFVYFWSLYSQTFFRYSIITTTVHKYTRNSRSTMVYCESNMILWMNSYFGTYFFILCCKMYVFCVIRSRKTKSGWEIRMRLFSSMQLDRIEIGKILLRMSNWRISWITRQLSDL